MARKISYLSLVFETVTWRACCVGSWPSQVRGETATTWQMSALATQSGSCRNSRRRSCGRPPSMSSPQSRDHPMPASLSAPSPCGVCGHRVSLGVALWSLRAHGKSWCHPWSLRAQGKSWCHPWSLRALGKSWCHLVEFAGTG